MKAPVWASQYVTVVFRSTHVDSKKRDAVMSTRAVDCHAAAAHCEDKLARVRVLLNNKENLEAKRSRKRRQRKAFIEAGFVTETIEDDVEYEHFDYLPNCLIIEYFTPGVLSSILYKEIDGPLVNTKSTLVTLKKSILTPCSMENSEEITTKPNNEEMFTSQIMDNIDENADIKSQLISSCEDKVMRLKAFLSARKKKRRTYYANNNNIDKHQENNSQTQGNVNFSVCQTQTLPPVHTCSSEDFQNPEQSQSNDLSNSLLIVDGSPDSCYVSNDILTEQRSESLNDISVLDSDYESDIVESNLISCMNITRTVNDLTDESLYDENSLDVVRIINSDSDDDTEYGLSTICEVQEDEFVNSEIDRKDVEVEPKLVSVLVDSARKLEKKNCSPKEVTFSEAPPKVHLMCVWSYAARQARVGDWMQLALDRSRFKQRIANVDMAISWVLKPQHRSRVKFQRFMPWWNAQRRQEEAARKAREQEKLKIGLEAEKLRLENIQNQDSIIDNDVSDVLYEIIGKIDNNSEICKNHTIHGSTNFDSLNTVNGNDYVQVLNSHAPNTANVLSNNNVSDLIVSSLDNVDVTSHDKNGKPVNDFLPETSNYSKDFIIKVKNIDLDTSKSDPQIVSMSYISE